ncbi:hypothetical protein Tsp_06826, partial [Trichinella spiralis]|uniref:hypothetical protein n=1 Tax=Trichinella spiralis TaxID=6334 RepID=UPI0001EFC804
SAGLSLRERMPIQCSMRPTSLHLHQLTRLRTNRLQLGPMQIVYIHTYMHTCSTALIDHY